MAEGYAACQMLFENGEPQDFIYLAVNQAFETLTGLHQVTGRKVSEVIPGIRAADPQLFALYARVAMTGKPEKSELFVAALQQWLSLSVYSQEEGCFVAVFDIITARKQAEAALRESEATFRALTDTLPLAIYLSAGVEQVSEYVSPTMVKLFGYTKADIPCVAQWWPLAYPDATYRRQIAAEWTRRVEHSLATQSPIEPMETVVTCKDGSQRYVSWGFITLGEKNYAFGLDLTERNRAEQAVNREQALSKAIIDSIPGAFYVLDETGRYARWNAYQRDEIVGQSEDRVAGMDAAATVHPDDRALVQSRIGNVLAHGLDETVEGRVLLRGGPAYRWLLMTGRQMMIEGRPFLVGIGIDITERKQAGEKLRESETRYRTLIENVGEGIGLVDPQDHFTFANPAGDRIFGVPRGGLLGRSLREFTTPEQFAVILEQNRQREAGATGLYEIDIIRPDG
jgi:PAS domain S-box-containing protein